MNINDKTIAIIPKSSAMSFHFIYFT